MKSNNKQSSSTDDNPTEKRQRSASVDEIRDLYSALQGLVPNTLSERTIGENTDTSIDSKDSISLSENRFQGPLSSTPVTLEAKTTTSVDADDNYNSGMQCFKRLGSPAQKRTSCPLISVTHFNLSGRNRSQSLDTDIDIGSSSRQIVLRQDSILSNNQNKRLLKNTQKTQGDLFTIVKDFDQVDIDCDNRDSSQIKSTIRRMSESVQSMEAHQKMGIASTTKRDDQLLEVTCKNTSEKSTVYDEISTSKAKVSHTSVEKADKISEKDCKSDLSPIELQINKKRLSLGDVLERQRARFSDPRTPYRRRSIGGSLLLNAIASSSSASPKRRNSLASALALIARKNELQELLKNYQKMKLNERQNNISNDETNAGQSKLDRLTLPQSQDKVNVEGEMDELLRSIEQQQDLLGLNLEKLCCSERGVRRASVGAEMHNLLEAIQDLLASGHTTPANITPLVSTPSSRKTSLNDLGPGMCNESLDELEAYFKAKLEDINEQSATKTSLPKNTEPCKNLKTDGKIRNKSVVNHKRRSSAPQTTMSVPTLKPPEVHRSGSSVDLLKPSDALHLQTRSEDLQDLPRRRSRSAQNVHLLVPENKASSKSSKSTSSSPRIKGKLSNTARSSSSDSQIDRAVWKDNQVTFANQVSKRLQDWLERATIFSQQETVQTNDNQIQDDSFFVVVNSCSSDNESENKPKKSHSRFAMRKVLRKKIKRSKSINNLTQPHEEEKREKSLRFKHANKKIKRSKSLHSLLDKEESQPKETKKKTMILRSPQNLLRIGRHHLLRSKSMHASKKLHLEVKNSRATESDECFDDDNSSIGMNQKTSNILTINQSVDILDFTMASTGPRRSPSPEQKEKQIVNNKLKTGTKRSRRFPGHLPLFYQPGSEMPQLKPITNDSTKQAIDCMDVAKRKTSRKSFLFGNVETRQPEFYTQMSMTGTAASPLSQTSSSGMDEGYIRSPSRDGLDETPFTSPDINDFRYRTTSVESEDSGCPI